MYYHRPTKGDQYYDIAVDLYFNKGVGVTQITRQIPVGRSMLYRWFTKFAIENGLKEPSDMNKDTAKGQDNSTLKEGQSGSTDDVQVLRARIEELEEQLRHEKMRSEAYSTMIDLAESTFKVPIRKKSGAKR
jgi:transposase-like protein